MPNDIDDFIQALAKQAYRHQLLVNVLHAPGPFSLTNQIHFGMKKSFQMF
jgi:hypothetical protein